MGLITGKWKNPYVLHTIFFYHDRLEKYMILIVCEQL